MKERILKYLACPKCNSDLELTTSEKINPNEHVMEGSLTCKHCNISYPIIKGVPFFNLHLTDAVVDLNRKNFADEWNYFTSEIDIELAKAELDSYFHSYIDYKDLENKIVLDAGCGGGRFCTVIGEKARAKEVIGVDLSKAVFTAFKNTKHLNNVTIIQADILNLPFKKDIEKNIFDFIYSVGVIHHLPEPIKGFNSLVKHLKKDGKILVWVYGKEGNFLYINFADPIRKYITSRLPFSVNLALSFMATTLLWLIIYVFYFPLNIFTGKNIANKLLPYNEYFEYFRKRGFTDFWRTILDKIIPTISHYIDEKEFKGWFTLNNLQHEIHFRNGHSWIGMGYLSPSVSVKKDFMESKVSIN